MDKRKNNGGHSTKGRAGRKPKAEEDKTKNIIKKALKKLYSKDEDDDNIIAFLEDFSKTQKGQQFIAEHLLGKPKDVVDLEVTEKGTLPVGNWVKN